MKEKSYIEIQREIYKELQDDNNIKKTGAFSPRWLKKYIKNLEFRRKLNNEETYALIEKIHKTEKNKDKRIIKEIKGRNAKDFSEFFIEEETLYIKNRHRKVKTKIYK